MARKQAVAKEKPVESSMLEQEVIQSATLAAVTAIGKIATDSKLTNREAADLFKLVMNVRTRKAEGIVMSLQFAR